MVDLRLGNASGLTCVARLHALDAQMRIVVLTGFASIATAVEAVKLGATNYLSKPANSDDMPSDDAWRAHRLGLGVPEGRGELGDILWLETNAAELNGVSFTKGCYVGQENTARMNWRKKVNRRLFVVSGDGGDRERAAYPELGLTVVHARVDNIPANAILPEWLSPVLS